MKNERQTDFNEFARRIIPSDVVLCPGPDGVSSIPLSDGIVNLNQKVFIAPNATPAVLSFYSSDGKERVERELFTRTLIGERHVLPIQHVIYSGTGVLIGGREYGFLIKEFKEGETLDNVLRNASSSEAENLEVSRLLVDLGRDLYTLGLIKLPKFGKIEGNDIVGPSENCGWKDYYFYRLNKRVKILENLDQNKRVGKYTVGDVLELTPKLLTYAESHSDVLNTVTEPRFVHNDFHFLNILAAQSNGDWRISGILDLESATAGDQEFDLISIESQLNLTPEYKDLFMTNIEHFRAGYGIPVSNEYLQKRGLYHLTWSLSYFEAVMQMDTNLHPVNSQVDNYMRRHFEMLRGLTSGKSPEEVGAPSLF